MAFGTASVQAPVEWAAPKHWLRQSGLESEPEELVARTPLEWVSERPALDRQTGRYWRNLEGRTRRP